MRKIWLSFALLLFLPACSTLPIPIKNDTSLITDEMVNPDKLPQGNFSDINTILLSMRKHSYLYYAEAQKKRRNLLIASETTFYSSIVGVIGGLTKSLPTTIVGGVGAAGGSMYSERYKLEVQASNYESAADVMDCMILATEPLVNIHNLYFVSFSAESTPINSNEHLRSMAAEGVMKVRKKLEKLQNRFEFGKPDPSKIKDAVTQARADVQKPPVTGQMVASPDSEEDLSNKTLIIEYKPKIDACVATFTE